jgi:SNF2 family DNA or RNA helicase
MRRFILALDMGLGKTLIGCVFAKAFQQTFENLKIVIVCPVSLKKEWKRTAEEATGLQVDEDPESTNVTIHSWAKIPSDVPATISNYVIVFDEAHSMQSMATQRTKTALKLVQPDRCIGVLMLTGTPMKNGKPLNLFPLLRAARHPFGDNQKAFERHFCAGHDKSFGNRIVWDANGSSNLVQLRQHVASHLLYMTKEECLDKLPPKTREFKQVPVSSRHQLQHDSALNELAKVYNTTGNFENSGDLVLTAVQRVRQIGSFAKIDATVAVAKLVLLEQPAVVIFTSFVTVAKTVHKQLAEAGWQGEILTGETPSNKRQQLVDNFQAGLSPVFVLTYGAGGVGITLTAAHTIILLDRPWTPGEAQQAEDRVRRIGQTKPVTSIWMTAFDLDKQIDAVLEQKQNTCSVVLKEGEEDLSASAPKISVFALLKTILGKPK